MLIFNGVCLIGERIKSSVWVFFVFRNNKFIFYVRINANTVHLLVLDILCFLTTNENQHT